MPALCVSCLTVFSMLAHAEDTTLPWTVYQDITPTEKDGNYTFTTIGKSWVFPRVQLKETVGG